MRKVLSILACAAVGSAAMSAARADGESDGAGAESADPLITLLDKVLHDPVLSDVGAFPRPRIPRVTRLAMERLGHQIAAAAASAGTLGLPAAPERCTLGILHAHLGDLARAQLHLGACVQPDVGGELRERGGQTRAAIARALRKSALSPVDIDTRPSGWIASIEEYEEGAFATSHTLWLPPGKYHLRFAPTAAALRTGGAGVIARELTVQRHSRGSLFVEAPPPPARTTPGTGIVKFEEEMALEPPHTGPPPPEKHRSLLPERYRKGLSVAMPEEERTSRRAALSLQLGAGRLAPTDARPAATATRLAAHGRVAFAPRWFLELGADWTHRLGGGGEEPMAGDPAPPESSADAFGALLGARVVLWQPAELSLLAALRGRLEASDRARGGGALQLEARPISGWPLAVGGAVELERGQRTYSAFAAVELWTN